MSQFRVVMLRDGKIHARAFQEEKWTDVIPKVWKDFSGSKIVSIFEMVMHPEQEYDLGEYLNIDKMRGDIMIPYTEICRYGKPNDPDSVVQPLGIVKQ
jgi:hypothetical protein